MTPHSGAAPPLRPLPTRSWHRSLFRKYVLTLVSLVALVLAINAAVEVWFLYRETIAKVAHAQRDAATAADAATEAVLRDIERQVSWVTRASATTLAQHRDDYDALLDQAPIVLSLSFVDAEGRERVRARRSEGPPPASLDELGVDTGRRGFGPPLFRDGEPVSGLVMPHPGSGTGITVAQVRLTALAEALPAANLGEGSHLHLRAGGRVLGRSPDSPLAPGDPSGGAGDEGPSTAVYGRDAGGGHVLASYLPAAALPATLVVAQPVQTALAPLRDLLVRLAWLLAFGLVVAICASLVLARRMLVPIRALHAGAEQFAASQFDHRIRVRTGDEFEVLAGRFNEMAEALSGSYARLEREIERRTQDLARTVDELRRLEETGRAIVASLRMEDVTDAVAARAAALTNARAALLYMAEDTAGSVLSDGRLTLSAASGLPPGVSDVAPTLAAEAFAARADDRPERGQDLASASWFPGREAALAAGLDAALVLPLSDAEGSLGCIVALGQRGAGFPLASPDVLQAFTHQAVLAVRNAHLFHEVDEKGRQLAAADLHKTRFFANMSHELRTPLNAVLGYSELLVDGLYGPLSEKALDALERIQINGRHLLSLINDVLDFTKIEAGLLTLSLQSYALPALIEAVVAASASLAQAKGLAVVTRSEPGLPPGYGDERRLMQVLMNLVSNAIKFTEAGEIRIETGLRDDAFVVSVTDTGPGIAPEDQARIFEEFQQVDSSSTRRQGGTGLGLSIARRLVVLHGGRIEIESSLGAGSTFRVILPVRTLEARQAA